MSQWPPLHPSQTGQVSPNPRRMCLKAVVIDRRCGTEATLLIRDKDGDVVLKTVAGPREATEIAYRVNYFTANRGNL